MKTSYFDTVKQIEKLNHLVDEYNEKCRKEINEIHWKYEDLKRDLDKKSQKKMAVVKERQESYKKEIASEIEPYAKITRDTEKIYGLFEVLLDYNHNVDFKDTYDRKSPCIIDTVADDDYKKVWIYIIGNDKPKNCFSLNLRMKSVFQRMREWEEFRIDSKNLKDLPTEKELEIWYEKNKNNLRWKWGSETIYLPDVLKEHTSLEQEYEKARELWKSKEWQRAYWLYKKWYYENCYSRGTEKDEYKDIVLLLKTSDKNLPLLIGQIKSDRGKQEFERRLKG